jgi:hypothetical protein
MVPHRVRDTKPHSTFLIQLCGSAARPYWMSISVLRSPIATGPAAPPHLAAVQSVDRNENLSDKPSRIRHARLLKSIF